MKRKKGDFPLKFQTTSIALFVWIFLYAQGHSFHVATHFAEAVVSRIQNRMEGIERLYPFPSARTVDKPSKTQFHPDNLRA